MSEKVSVDLDLNNWPFDDMIDYRAKVKVNPQFAIQELNRALMAGDGSADNVPPEYLLGLAWITARREHPDFTYDDAAAAYRYREVIDAVMTWQPDEDADPQTAPNRAARRSKSSRAKTTSLPTETSSDSASSTPDGTEGPSSP